MPSLNFLTIIKFQTHATPLAQVAKYIYKLINRHIALIKGMHTHHMILLKCNTTKAKENIIVCLISFFNTLIILLHQHNKFTTKQYLHSY
jgi:hypothetical protein